MKTALLTILLFSLSQVQAAEFLTKKQAINVLQAVDNICGDSWCEGDFNYSFNEIKCDKETNSCQFSFEFINEVYDKETYELVKEERLSAICTLTGLSKYSDMVEKNGELTIEFYEKVGECISNEEELAYATFDLGY